MDPWTNNPIHETTRNAFDKNKTALRIILLATALGLYVLEGILLNPLILWTSLPIYIGYLMVISARKTQSKKKKRQGYGYLIVSIGFSYFYHFAWFFDWGGTKTGGSTSGLIFVWFPIYAVLLGFIGYFLGSIGGENSEAR